MKAKTFLDQLQHKDIEAAIRHAEQKTTGEIRVFVSRHEPAEIIASAQKEFDHLGMHKTADKNGVLIYVAPAARKFAIIGDAGVHQRCGDSFWQAVAGEMTEHFKKTRFTEGIIHGLQKAGQLLAEHFPAKGDHPNQLPDDVAHD
jgi:uncharacterized membrane protein